MSMSTYIKICKEHYSLFKVSKNGENVSKILFKMVVNVEKLLKMVKMVIFHSLSKNGEMLKNVGENIKTKFLHWSSFTPRILKYYF